MSVLTMMRPIMKPICWKLPNGASGLYFAETVRYSSISGRGSSSRLSSALTLSLWPTPHQVLQRRSCR